MVTAVCMALVAAMGVGFGWQPMPDGSPRYEYIVEIEPEMLQSLAAGRSIPIVSDVPQGVGPIARVRVVVGRGKVERRLFKPVVGEPQAADATGVVLTQYSEPAGQRYGSGPGTTPPYGAPASAGLDPYTQAAPGAAGGGAAWNGGGAAEGTWNGGGPVAEVADSSAGTGPLRRVGAELQEAAQPLQEGVDRFGRRIRDAADNLGDRTGR